MVSIIVPVYNVQNYLSQCVQSIVAQTYQDWELLLLDDGSTDRSGSLCDRWAARDLRIHVVHKQNEGLGPTRNVGVQMARGDVLAFVDSDDWIEPDFLEAMMAAMGDADLVFCDYLLERIDCTLTGRRYTWMEASVPLASCPQLLYTMGAATWNKLYRRALWDRVQLKQPAHAFEDTAVMPLLWEQANRIVQVRRALNHYRIDRPESITNQSAKLPEMMQSIQEITSAFAAGDLSKRYAPYLAKYCAMALGIPLSRLSEGEMAQRRHAEECYYAQFPFARTFDEQPRIVLGGVHGRYTLEKTCFLRSRLHVVPLDKSSLNIWSSTQFNGWVLLDLASDPDADVGTLVSVLQQAKCRPVLLESFWPHGYGLYGVEALYKNQLVIEEANQKLRRAYQTLEANLPNMPVVRCNDFAFTDTESPLRCHPPFQNNYYYYYVADRLRQIMGGNTWTD